LTVDEDECRAWLIPANIRTQQTTSEIHNDIGRRFIRAEVVDYGELLRRGTIATCRDHVEVHLESNGYIVKDDDIIDFRLAT
jgi:ribosome-binding ATPase YchF (GTP1/OBG family)